MNILVKSTNWVGDAVLQTPALRALRRGFPDAHIALAAREWVAPLFRSHPDVDEVIVEPRPKSERRALGRALRGQRRWDLGLALPNSFTAATLLWRAGAKRRRGFARDARRILLNDPVPLEPWLLHVHEVDYYRHLLRGLVEFDDQDRQPVMPPSPEGLEELHRVLSEQLVAIGMEVDAPLVILGAAAAFGTAKRWLPERFAACASALRDRHGLIPTLIGSDAEQETASQIVEKIGAPVLNLAGKLSLAGLVALLAKAKLFVTNDSGPMHLAAAQGTPTVAVFGSTNWKTTAPLGPCVRIVREPVDCAPCLRRDCPIDHRCMEAVDVDRVLSVAEELLDRSPCAINQITRM